jgi:hypothetical protein
MKSLNLTNAFEILTQVDAIVLEGRVLAPTLFDLEYEPENEFMRLLWSENGLDFEVAFNEGDNNELTIDGSLLTLVNSEGEEETVTLLGEFDGEALLEY